MLTTVATVITVVVSGSNLSELRCSKLSVNPSWSSISVLGGSEVRNTQQSCW